MEPEVVTAPEGVVLDHDHPWPGLVSFTEANYSFFFGREREVAGLARLVRQETLTVFFGKSGLGKSSILRAGLSPLLRESEFVPVYIRLNHAEAAPPLEDQVEIAIENVSERERIDAPKPVRAETLWEYFHKKESDWWDAENRLIKPILIFDQFEELMTLGQENPVRSERTSNFLTELEDLIENRPPATLAARFKNEPGLTEQFDHRRSSFRIILSLREDFLPDLEGLRERLSPIMRNRFRLLPMNGEQALDVILKAGADLVDEDIAIKIVDLVSSSERSRLQSDITRAHLAKRAIEPALLSVVLQELNNRRIKAGEPKISAELVGTTNAAEIFQDFYQRGLLGMDEKVREFIEDSLLTSFGARNRIAEEDALTKPGISADILTKLIDRRIVQRETVGNIKWLELTHDTLADVVRADRTEHHQERALKLAAAREAETRRKLRRVQALAVAFAVLSIAALVALFYARAQKRSAQSAQKTAETARKLTTETTDRLATGILRKIEQNPRIRVKEKLFLTQRLIDSVREVRKASGASAEITMRLADLLATASLILFDAGRIDEASDYASQAQELVSPSAPVPSNMPLVVARAQLSFLLAQRYGWQIDEEQALAFLDRIEGQLRDASVPPSDKLLADILKAKLAWTRTDTLRAQSSFETADGVALAAIGEIEKELPASPMTQDDPRTIILQNLTQELLKLHVLRYRNGRSGGRSGSLEEIHSSFEKDLVAAKARFPSAPANLWSYFDAKILEAKASIRERDGDYDQAVEAIGAAIENLHQLLLDDPENLTWRFELGMVLAHRASATELAAETEVEEDQKVAVRRLAEVDRDAARKLASTLLRDQRNRYLSFRLASAAGDDTSPIDAATSLTRINLEEQRSGPKQEFKFLGQFAHSACMRIDLKKELYSAAVQEAQAALEAIDQLKFSDKEIRQRATLRLSILGEILRIDAAKIGPERWATFAAAAEKEVKDLLEHSKLGDRFSRAAYIALLRGDQFRREKKDREAIPYYKRASELALAAIKEEVDRRADLQNYFYAQRCLLDSDAELGEWDAALAICRDTHTELSTLVTENQRLGLVFGYIEYMASGVDAAIKAFKRLPPPAAKQAAPKIAETLAAESKFFNDQAREFKRVANTAPSVSRIDLQNSLKDLRTPAGAGARDNHWFVKQRLGWTDAPMYSADWITVTGKDFDDLAARLAHKKEISAGQIQRIRACPLNFYEHGQLVEAEYFDAKGHFYTVTTLLTPAAVYILDGNIRPIMAANQDARLRLRNATDAAAYLRLYCSYIRLKVKKVTGAFPIIESAQDLPWTPSAPSKLREAIGRLVRPLVVWSDPDGDAAWRARATVQFSTAIFHAAFKIQKDGNIDMTDDEAAAANMPFLLPVYKAGDRSTGKLATLDLSVVDPPVTPDEGMEGYDDVEGLLAVATLPKEKRPAHYLELAEAAATLQFGISRFDDEQSDVKLRSVVARVSGLYFEAGQYEKAVQRTAELAKVLESKLASMQATDKTLPALQRRYTGTLVSLSWFKLFTKDFPGALRAAEAGEKIVKEVSLPLETNRAHALLFLGRTTEAEEIYRKYIGQKIEADSPKMWEETILADFDELQKKGVTHPEFDRIRKILNPAGTKP